MALDSDTGTATTTNGTGVTALTDAATIAARALETADEAVKLARLAAAEVRAKWRSLQDFGGREGLSEPELKLVDACRRGEWCKLRDDLPPIDLSEEEARKITIRSQLLRFLLLGGDRSAPVHERGVRLIGAIVTDQLGLRAAVVPVPMILLKCRMGVVSMRDATTRVIELDGSDVDGLNAARATIGGGCYLRDGFRSTGTVRLEGATIKGDLGCRNATFSPTPGTPGTPGGAAMEADRLEVGGGVYFDGGFTSNGTIILVGARIGGDIVASSGKMSSPEGDCLVADRVEVRGGIYLDKGFAAQGGIRLIGARVGAEIDCRGGSIVHARGEALNADGSVVGQSVRLSDGFYADGAVRFAGAKIEGDVELFGGHFRCARWRREDRKHHVPRSASAIVLERTTIGGSLWLASDHKSSQAQVKIDGSVVLIGAFAKTLVFDPQSLPAKTVEDVGLPGQRLDTIIDMDGFTYSHLVVEGDQKPHDAMERFLKRQPSRHQGADFRPQPYEQLIKTFVAMGREDEARAVAKRKAESRRKRESAKNIERLTRAYRSRKPGVIPAIAWAFGLAWILLTTGMAAVAQNIVILLWDRVLGGGWGQKRFVLFFVALWLACAGLYRQCADVPGAFVPVDQSVLTDPQTRAACAGPGQPSGFGVKVHWTACVGLPKGFNDFNPLFYSLDLMSPFSLLGQRRDWQPTHDAVTPNLPFVGEVELGKGVLLGTTWAQLSLSLALYILLTGLVTGLIKKG